LCHLPGGPAIRIAEQRAQGYGKPFLVAVGNREFGWNQLGEASHRISNNRDMRCGSLDRDLRQAFVARGYYYRIQEWNQLFYIVPPPKKADSGRDPELFSQPFQYPAVGPLPNDN